MHHKLVVLGLRYAGLLPQSSRSVLRRVATRIVEEWPSAIRGRLVMGDEGGGYLDVNDVVKLRVVLLGGISTCSKPDQQLAMTAMIKPLRSRWST